ncbi:MAG: iron-sulfur flavoprotein [uncultured bacterium]|nr:MAG: iron-sulfur flavoprotein [uncultured bacterium]
MKIIAFNSSPRKDKGNTHVMVTEFLRGAQDAGAETENIFLAEQEIKPCVGCFNCWLKTPGVCVYHDDVTELKKKAESADVLVFATPLYVDNVSGIMKNFLDRLIPSADPHFELDENGETRHKLPVHARQPKLAVISNCGFPEQSQFQVLRLLFKRMARNMQTELVAEIYRGAGELLQVKHPLLWLKIHGYKKLLRQAGKEVVLQSRLSVATQQKLEEPLIDSPTYVKHCNEWVDKAVKRSASIK